MTSQERGVLIARIEALPAQVEAAVAGATEGQLDRPYRKGGWNSRQVVHHLADSHMNAYVRARLILTEDNPTLKPYDQEIWAGLPDAAHGALGPSLSILKGLHARWGAFFRALPEAAWARQGFHPEYGPVSLEGMLKTYSQHGESHLEQIRTGMAGQRAVSA